MRSTLKTTLRLTTASALAAAALGLRAGAFADESPGGDAAKAEVQFRESVRPFLESYCLGCHGGEKPKGDLDLTGFNGLKSAAEDLPRWDAVREQLEAESMPPAKAKRRPTAEAVDKVVAWIESVRSLEAARNAGDPGPVAARRLSNAEYDHTIRDLTGVDMRPTREFPVDPANEAGFDNSAESLAMSPALVRKYLQAAREVADHVVLTPTGLAFAPYSVLADTDRDKYCVNAVVDFYRRQKTDYADYFEAAWTFQRRAELGRPETTLQALAVEGGLSPKYLATIWKTLNDREEEFGPTAALQAMWRELPTPSQGRADPAPRAARADCERMRGFVVALRRRLTPKVKNLTAPRIGRGSQPFVLWKDRRMAANRMRYSGGALEVHPGDFGLEGKAAEALRVPREAGERDRYEATFEPFCKTFPDAFYISERARVFLDDEDRNNTGRLLSAGFHSMTGYFRDDGPLYELMLDDDGRRELDRLWRDFDFITGAPIRQYSSYLWYERAETGFLKGDPAFDFVRAEDRDASSDAKMGRLAEVYLAKARRYGADPEAVAAIEDQFAIFSETIHRLERDRRAAEPRHVEALQAFAERAYRRPLTSDERQGVASFYRVLREEDGLDHDDAVRDAVVGVLMSPRFCYRLDLAGEGTGVRPLSDYDLASRLSYFLWASMPDPELLAVAAAGELQRPETLAAQARRMIQDDRVRGLATEFGGNWLDFRRFEEHNSVDRGRFPTFDDALRQAMFEEPIRFFVDLVRNDRSVLEFIDGRHTFVNPALARHYGMPEQAAGAGPDGWRRVDDAWRYGRGGLTPMAVFLTKNAPGLRTSPVKRGYWVVRRLLGENIPPPPPDVPDLPDDEAKLGDRTLRETLARHRDDKACAGCHERFDSIGLAFEGFGPIGEARTRDLGGRPIDARATFPGGGEGDGVDGLRAYLTTRRRAEFVDGLCRKLLAYALGRSLIPSDDLTIDAMRRKLADDHDRFGGLVETIVASPQFRNKRLEGDKHKAE